MILKDNSSTYFLNANTPISEDRVKRYTGLQEHDTNWTGALFVPGYKHSYKIEIPAKTNHTFDRKTDLTTQMLRSAPRWVAKYIKHCMTPGPT